MCLYIFRGTNKNLSYIFVSCTKYYKSLNASAEERRTALAFDSRS